MIYTLHIYHLPKIRQIVPGVFLQQNNSNNNTLGPKIHILHLLTIRPSSLAPHYFLKLLAVLGFQLQAQRSIQMCGN